MFKNPLKKYQQGGTATTQDQQKLLAAFIEWLPKRVKEFQGMQPDAVAKALDGMSKTPEGQKQVQQLMQQFQQEMQGGQQSFKSGGKLHDFICKHAKGGVVDCGCGVKKAEDGSGNIFRTFARTMPIGKLLFPTAEERAIRSARRTPDLENVTERRIGFGTDNTGKQVLFEDAVVDGNSAETFVEIPQPGDTIIRQNVLTRHGLDNRTYPIGSDQYNNILNRLRGEIPSEQNGGKVSGDYNRAVAYYKNHANEGIIRKLQNFLSARGYDVGDLDGVFGKRTYNAIRQYQRDNGLIDDGMWGEDTNLVHRVLGAGDTTFNGKNSGAHFGKHTYGDNFVNKSRISMGTVSMKDINSVIEKAILNPEWFWGDSADAARWRQLFAKGTPDGKGGTNYGAILEDIWRETPDNIKSKIDPKKLPENLKAKLYENIVSQGISNAAPTVAGIVTAPLAITNPIPTAGAIIGGKVLGNVGENVGKDIAVKTDNGYENKNRSAKKDVIGFNIPLVKPDKSLEGRAVGTAVGTVLGGLAAANLPEVSVTKNITWNPQQARTGSFFKRISNGSVKNNINGRFVPRGGMNMGQYSSGTDLSATISENLKALKPVGFKSGGKVEKAQKITRFKNILHK